MFTRLLKSYVISVYGTTISELAIKQHKIHQKPMLAMLPISIHRISHLPPSRWYLADILGSSIYLFDKLMEFASFSWH